MTTIYELHTEINLEHFKIYRFSNVADMIAKFKSLWKRRIITVARCSDTDFTIGGIEPPNAFHKRWVWWVDSDFFGKDFDIDMQKPSGFPDNDLDDYPE